MIERDECLDSWDANCTKRHKNISCFISNSMDSTLQRNPQVLKGYALVEQEFFLILHIAWVPTGIFSPVHSLALVAVDCALSRA